MRMVRCSFDLSAGHGLTIFYFFLYNADLCLDYICPTRCIIYLSRFSVQFLGIVEGLGLRAKAYVFKFYMAIVHFLS